MTKFKKLLQEKLKTELPDADLFLLPTGFQQLGDKAILTIHPQIEKYQQIIARELLNLFPFIKGVYLKTGGISGKFRTPHIKFLLGEDSPEIIHKEHQILYKFNLKQIMFAKGNINERARIARLVNPGEIIFDLFAGIGYFSLVIGRTLKPKKIYAFEFNPISYKYLLENIKLNKINEPREIITPIFGDSKLEALKITDKADRVIMGLLPAPKDHIDTVFQIIKPKAIVHYEGLINENQSVDDLFHDFLQINKQYYRQIKLINTQKVKSYGPKTYHVTLDIEIS
ncbi:MAG: class I SAM-dependent methyltransferase [Candidatus Helarchaeota archaeon]